MGVPVVRSILGKHMKENVSNPNPQLKEAINIAKWRVVLWLENV